MINAIRGNLTDSLGTVRVSIYRNEATDLGQYTINMTKAAPSNDYITLHFNQSTMLEFHHMLGEVIGPVG